MADGFLVIYLGANLLALMLFVICGALLSRRKRWRGALIGLALGALVGPLAVNMILFDAPDTRPIPKLVAGQ